MREVVCLNRVFRWCLPTSGRPEAIEIEADARQVEILIHQLNLPSGKSLATPGVKSTSSDIGLALPLEKHTLLRSMRTRASYLSEDWPDARFASGEPQLSSYRRRFHTGETHEKLAHMLNSLVCVSSWVKIVRKLPTCQTPWSVSVTGRDGHSAELAGAINGFMQIPDANEA